MTGQNCLWSPRRWRLAAFRMIVPLVSVHVIASHSFGSSMAMASVMPLKTVCAWHWATI